jgi:hypothetical protein
MSSERPSELCPGSLTGCAGSRLVSSRDELGARQGAQGERRYGIRLLDGPAGIEPAGEWLESFDYDEHAPGRPYPTGGGSSTLDPERAMSFESIEAAWEAWRRPSTVTPTRPHDGKPNRPMTVFTIAVEPLP